MAKVTIVYWSGTGNTAAMAELVAEGVTAAGKDAEVLNVEDVSTDVLDGESVFALGCPSMGAEQLEESTMEPFFAELEGSISGKQIGLFGSYGWGGGEWMREWEARVQDAGATIVNGEGVIANGAPEPETEDALRALGGALAALV